MSLPPTSEIATSSNASLTSGAVMPSGPVDLATSPSLVEDKEKHKKKCNTCGDKDKDEDKDKDGKPDGTLKPGSAAAADAGVPPKDVAGTGTADAMVKDSHGVLEGSAGVTEQDGTVTGSAKGMGYAGGQNINGDGTNSVKVLGGEGELTGSAGNGQANLSASAKGGLTEMNTGIDGKTTLGGQQVTGAANAKLQVLEGNASGTANISSSGLGGNGEAQASLTHVEASASGSVGDLSAKANLEGNQVYAKADGQFLLGTSGTKTGVALGGSTESGLLGGTAKGSVSVPIGWVPGVPAGTTVTFGGEAGGVLGAGPSASAGGFAYYDSATGRTSVGAVAGGGLGVAGKLGLNISVGPASK